MSDSRNDVIEECAKVCDAYAGEHQELSWKVAANNEFKHAEMLQLHQYSAENCAGNIRRLKNSPPPPPGWVKDEKGAA